MKLNAIVIKPEGSGPAGWTVVDRPSYWRFEMTGGGLGGYGFSLILDRRSVDRAAVAPRLACGRRYDVEFSADDGLATEYRGAWLDSWGIRDDKLTLNFRVAAVVTRPRAAGDGPP